MRWVLQSTRQGRFGRRTQAHRKRKWAAGRLPRSASLHFDSRGGASAGRLSERERRPLTCPWRLITRRSQVQILPPLSEKALLPGLLVFRLTSDRACTSVSASVLRRETEARCLDHADSFHCLATGPLKGHSRTLAQTSDSPISRLLEGAATVSV